LKIPGILLILEEFAIYKFLNSEHGAVLGTFHILKLVSLHSDYSFRIYQ